MVSDELSSLREISEIISSSLQLHEVFDQVMRVLASHLGIAHGRLIIHDVARGQLKIQTAHGLSPDERSRGFYAIGEGITGQVFATGKGWVVPDVRKEPAYLDRTGSLKELPEPYSFICLPITSEGRTIGVLSVDKPFVDDESLERDRRLLTIVTAMISQAVRIHGMVHREKEELLEELVQLRKTLSDRYQFANIVGSSPAMLEVYRTIDQVARTRATVLLIGETGTGKEMIAKAIHFNSDRREKAFIRVNCGALSGQLLESELFGHVKGAFTGAVRDNIGRFEAADGGTLFLDEIGTLEMGLQVKLLRVLQEREFERVGDHHTMSTDVRIIAATNANLEEEIRNRRFREDLYYRLNVVSIRLPPLRERREDIPQLIDHFLDKYNAENDRPLRKISQDLLNLLLRYPWPGNVRELENVIERAVVLSRGEHFTEDLLPLTLRSFAEQSRPALRGETPEQLLRRVVIDAMDAGSRKRWGLLAKGAAAAENGAGASDGEAGKPGTAVADAGKGADEPSIWDTVTGQLERALIQEALQRCGCVKIKAADYLGINRNTLNKKYHDLGLDSWSPEPITTIEEPSGPPRIYDPFEVLRKRIT
jgi:Nif-specific regulatory protein